jgi:hypothetical protein
MLPCIRKSETRVRVWQGGDFTVLRWGQEETIPCLLQQGAQQGVHGGAGVAAADYGRRQAPSLYGAAESAVERLSGIALCSQSWTSVCEKLQQRVLFSDRMSYLRCRRRVVYQTYLLLISPSYNSALHIVAEGLKLRKMHLVAYG